MVPQARALQRAGHTVSFATAEEFCPLIRKNGFEAFPAGMSLTEQLEKSRQRFPEAHGLVGGARFESFVPRMLGGVAAPARAADLPPIIERWQPDLILHDETEFGAPLAATQAGIPYADQSVGILRPLEMSRLAAAMLEPLYERWGVDMAPHAGLFRYLYLDVCPPSLQSPEISEVPTAHQVQNVDIHVAGDDPGPSWLKELPAQSTIYVSLGTIFNRDTDLFTIVLEALRDEPFNIILTVGNDNDPARFGDQPDNVHIERYITQELVLPCCDVVVNQGGTAILPMLAHRIPLLLMPQGANQFHNAEACASAGVGRYLLPGTVTAGAVLEAVRVLLERPEYRAAAGRLGDELAAMPSPSDGVALLERLADERQPLLRP